MSIDTIGNFLTIIRNGIMASKLTVEAPYSKFKEELCKLLKEEGFIRDFSLSGDKPAIKKIKVFLKYVDGESVVHEITRVSTPGCRCYRNSTSLKPVIGGLGISIVSTNKGIMTDKTAKKLSIGGEVVCTVW
ncbi:MAG: 30S ribosomal protein S8 [candidate division TM6 bacterium GW2011_GWF2_32_72]|nr:MAG: 30S ribosomal protein S8 [candidate division TM6 bacterium GW2011_GWF2_32_72]